MFLHVAIDTWHGFGHSNVKYCIVICVNGIFPKLTVVMCMNISTLDSYVTFISLVLFLIIIPSLSFIC